MVLSTPVLVGRDNELNSLLRSLDSAFNANGQTIFVSGEAGSGKTRLVNEFLDIARRRDVNILSGWCLSNANVPYFPFVEAFSGFQSNIEELFATVSSQQLSTNNEVQPRTAHRFSSVQGSPQVLMDLTFASVTRELLNLSTKKPTILILEDVHWADSASLALLQYVSRSVTSEKILILATFRSEGLSFDLEGQPLPLLETLRSMGREDLYCEVKLSNLNQDEISLLAASMLGGRLQDSFLEKLSLESRGNPLFIIESLRTLTTEGSLIQENNMWRPSTDKIIVPSKVKDIILQRVARLKLKQRKILDVAAVLGEKFDYRLLASVLRQEQILILEKLNAIARSTSLIKCVDASYSFDHAKSREIIYDELPTPLKTGYHMAIAERLEAISVKNESIVASDLAYHYEKAGNARKTLKYSLLAGKEALAKSSNVEAKKYFLYVLNIAGDVEEYTNERVAAIEGLGDALLATGEFLEAQATFQKLMNNTGIGLVKLRALRKAMACARWRGDFSQSLEFSGEAECLKDFSSLEHARVLLNKGAAMGSYGRTKDALKCLEEALSIFEEKNSLLDIAQTLNESACLYQTEGYPEQAVATAKRAIALNEEIGDYRGQVEAYFYAGQIFFNYRLYEEALSCFDKSKEIAEKIGYTNRTAWASLYSAIVLGNMGRLEEALARNLTAVKHADKIDSHYVQSQAYSGLLVLYSKLGDLANAELCYSRIKRLFPDASKAGSQLGYSSMIRAEALFFAAKNDWARSNELFSLSLDLLQGALFPELFEAMLREDYANALEKQRRITDADVQRKKVLAFIKKVDNQFSMNRILTNLMVKKESEISDELEFRFNIVNVSKRSIYLTKANHLVPPSFSICKMPTQHILTRNALDLKKQKLSPFQLATVKFSLRSDREGVFHIIPEVAWEDETGHIEISKPQPVTITIIQNSQVKRAMTEKSDYILLNEPKTQVMLDFEVDFRFKTEASDRLFDFLATSFITDYMRLRLPLEKAGWRTSMDAVKHGRVPISCVYGRSGHSGQAIAELVHRGLIETRFFQGERGRGGNIMKLRICYEKEPVKRQIDLKIAGKK